MGLSIKQLVGFHGMIVAERRSREDTFCRCEETILCCIKFYGYEAERFLIFIFKHPALLQTQSKSSIENAVSPESFRLNCGVWHKEQKYF